VTARSWTKTKRKAKRRARRSKAERIAELNARKERRARLEDLRWASRWPGPGPVPKRPKKADPTRA
jgi:hypothetical protein